MQKRLSTLIEQLKQNKRTGKQCCSMWRSPAGGHVHQAAEMDGLSTGYQVTGRGCQLNQQLALAEKKGQELGGKMTNSQQEG